MRNRLAPVVHKVPQLTGRSILDGLDSCPRDPEATSEVLVVGLAFYRYALASACQAVSS